MRLTLTNPTSTEKTIGQLKIRSGRTVTFECAYTKEMEKVFLDAGILVQLPTETLTELDAPETLEAVSDPVVPRKKRRRSKI